MAELAGPTPQDAPQEPPAPPAGPPPTTGRTPGVGATTPLEALRPALPGLALLTVLTGVVFPLTLAALARPLFPRSAGGSLVTRDGAVVGSEWIGQSFSAPGYFHPRPSAAGDGYDATASGGSNLGPANPRLRELVRQRAD